MILRVVRKSSGPRLASQGDEHVGEGGPSFGAVPGGEFQDSLDVAAAVAVLEVPEYDDSVGQEGDWHRVTSGLLASPAAGLARACCGLARASRPLKKSRREAKRASTRLGTRQRDGAGGLPGRRARLDERDDASSKRAKPQ